MKNSRMLIMLFAAFMLTFGACKKDDSTSNPGVPVEINTLELSDDNTTITVTFNEAVYSNNDKTGNLDANSFGVGISDATVSATFTATHIAGQATATIHLIYENPIKAGVTIQVTAKASKIYNVDSGALEADITKSVTTNGTPAEITNLEISNSNESITVTFNEAIYSKNDKTGNLDDSCFGVAISDASVTATFTVNHVAGENVATINLTYANRIKGGTTIQVTAKNNMVFNMQGQAIDADFSKTITANETGIIGKWSAYDISLILVGMGFDDSLYATFNADQSYVVTAYYGGAPVPFSGSYTMEKSQFNDIWNIVLNQSSPSSLTSQGIFKIYTAAPDSMWYEVAQVDPAIAGVTPPTAEAGFGSTSSGAFGTMNVQKYHWIGQK
jgi:hypothetical protein